MGPSGGDSAHPEASQCDVADGVAYQGVEARFGGAGRFRRLQFAAGVDASPIWLLETDFGSFSAWDLARQCGESAPRSRIDGAGNGIRASISILSPPLMPGFIISDIRSRAAMRCVPRMPRRRSPMAASIAMLPGSRTGEVRRHMPVLAPHIESCSVDGRATRHRRRRRRARRTIIRSGVGLEGSRT